LNPLDQSGEFLSTFRDDLLSFGELGEEGNNGGSRVTSYDGNVGVSRVGSCDFGNEFGSSDEIESGYTEKTERT